MRRPVEAVLLALLALAGCRRAHAPAPVPQAAAPRPVAAAAPAVTAPAVAAPGPGFVPVIAPAVDAGVGPSDAELRATLDAHWDEVGRCMAAARGDAAVSGPFGLRFSVAPSGEVADAVLDGLPAANRCVRALLAPLRFPGWSGATVGVAIALGEDGHPIAR